MIYRTPEQQRLLECLADPSCKVTYWCSDQWGGPANHECLNYGADWRAYPGRVDDIGGTPKACSDRGLHATDYPHQWKGVRVWIVGLWNWVEGGNKYTGTRREVICEIAPESVLDQSVAARMNLTRADLSGARLSRAYLSGARLSYADLSGADLSGARLSRADLSYARLSYADLSGARLSYADLSGAKLLRAYLSYADLSGADLSYADLSGARLSYADLSRSDLSGADLSRARLSRADLSRADLSGARLSRARLSRADLSRADLHKCDMRGITGTTLTQRLDFAARGAVNVDTETQ